MLALPTMGVFAPPPILGARARLAVGRRFALRLASGDLSEFISELTSEGAAAAAAVLGMGPLPNMGRVRDSRRAARRDLRAAARTGCSGLASEGGFEGGDRVWGGDRV